MRPALLFLKQKVKTYKVGDPFGLNQMPFMLYNEVAKMMEEYKNEPCQSWQHINTRKPPPYLTCIIVYEENGKHHIEIEMSDENGVFQKKGFTGHYTPIPAPPQ